MMMRLIMMVAILLMLGAAVAATGPSRTVWEGVYSKEQAERGKKAYGSLCARCHGDTLLGNDDASPLVGKDFVKKWEGKTVESLVELTRKEMPTDGPGKLDRKQCTDITAYLLSANDFPAGKSELVPEPDALKEILIRTEKK